MLSLRLYIVQRVTALLMVPLLIVHLAVIFYTTRHALSSADILSRTRGSGAWASFYGLFVICVSLHAAIGIRAVLCETTGLRGRMLTVCTWALGLALFAAGTRAVLAVTFP